MPEEKKTELIAQDDPSAPETIRSEHFRTVYANSTRLGLSPWDIRFTFASLIESIPQTIVNEEQVTVVMSPQHAKVVLSILQTNLAAWENQFGKVANPLEEHAGRIKSDASANAEIASGKQLKSKRTPQ